LTHADFRGAVPINAFGFGCVQVQARPYIRALQGHYRRGRRQAQEESRGESVTDRDRRQGMGGAPCNVEPARRVRWRRLARRRRELLVVRLGGGVRRARGFLRRWLSRAARRDLHGGADRPARTARRIVPAVDRAGALLRHAVRGQHQVVKTSSSGPGGVAIARSSLATRRDD
jgi:hypothetical protein